MRNKRNDSMSRSTFLRTASAALAGMELSDGSPASPTDAPQITYLSDPTPSDSMCVLVGAVGLKPRHLRGAIVRACGCICHRALKTRAVGAHRRKEWQSRRSFRGWRLRSGEREHPRGLPPLVIAAPFTTKPLFEAAGTPRSRLTLRGECVRAHLPHSARTDLRLP
jgi:hypothetical protein